MARRATWLLALALAACVPPGAGPTGPASTRKPGSPTAPKATATPRATPTVAATATAVVLAGPRLLGRVVAAGSALIADSAGRVLSDQGGGFISDQGGGIVANNGGGFRLLALAAGGVGGASVQLVDPTGQTIGEAVRSIDTGAFDLPAPPPVGGPYTLRATFGTAGKAFTWRAAIAPPVLLDEASTLAAERPDAAPAAQAQLAAALRQALAADVLPYMANDSGDRAAALDQLLLDRAELRAAVDPALAQPRGTWTVDTPVSSALLAGTAVGDRLDGPAGIRAFLPDLVSGILVTIPAAAGMRLVKLVAGQKPVQLTQLPKEVGAPVRLARGADGKVRVAARVRDGLDVRVWEVAPDGTVAQLPGVLAAIGSQDDLDLGQVAVDAQGRVHMADTRAHVIRRLGPTDAVSTVLAGTEGEAGAADGQGAAARFSAPEGVAIAPDGSLYVADTANHTLRRVAPDGTVTTVAGSAAEPAYRNGRGLAARLGAPEALAFGPGGDVFVADREARRIRRLSKAGSVFLVAGSGEAGNADGAGPVASFRQPSQLALGPDGALYLRDPLAAGGELVIRRLTPPK